jgi:uncharacterized tellurite resistance protein B-like protein
MLTGEPARGLGALDRAERMRLMRFVCSFAWADLEIRPEERSFVARMISRLDLDRGESRLVEAWLDVPPEPEAVDPTLVPLEHRKLFVESVEGMILADGEVSPEERENLTLFQRLLP